MAVEVKYFEGTKENPIDRNVFREGPFVIVWTTGYRIEVDNPNGYCSCLPDRSIYDLRESLGYELGKGTKERISVICDHLNSLVKSGRVIQRESGLWYCPEFDK